MIELVDYYTVGSGRLREYYLDSDCAWWNGELHIPVTEKVLAPNNKGIKSISPRDYYCIVRLDRLHDIIISDTNELISDIDHFREFIENNQPEKTRMTLKVDKNFDFFHDCYFRMACRVNNRAYRMRRYPEKYDDFENKSPIEEVSVEEHRELENTVLSVQELADYMECSVYRARTLMNCPQFPARKVGRSYKVSLGALNLWIKERKEREYAIRDVATSYLIRYLTEKEEKNRTPSKKR